MLKLFSRKVKKGVGIASLACFLCMPLSYGVNMSSAAAASWDQVQYDSRHDDRDRNNPPPPPKDDRDDDWDNDRHDRDRDKDYDKDKKRPPRDDRWDDDDDDDDDEGYSKGNIVSAVLIGGVIGAIIAKNT